MEHSTRTAGIDIGKQWLDIALSDGPVIRLANDEDGHRALAAWLGEHGVGRVGIEASGGYEQAAVACLRRAGFAVLLLQPVQVRAYAMFRLKRAKNDRIDAALIAECAASATLRAAPDPRLQALLEPLTLIEQIEEDLVRMKTRRETFRAPRHRALVEAEIARLKRWRAAEIALLAKEIHSHPDIARRMMLIQSVPGIGRRTALALLIRMPELGTLSREQAAALAGLAPFDRDSGNSRRQRRIQGGRTRLRKSLYAAALPAAFRWNPALIALYQRLTGAGKAHKQALVACARKLLLYVNVTVARDTQWTPHPLQS